MGWPLRQSTASQEIPLGPFVDSTDGNTQETGLTIANTDIKVYKAGGTTESSKNSGGATHIANGRYYAVLDATDTDTVGPMRVSVHVAGALAVWLDCVVYEEAIYDALFAASANAFSGAAGSTTLTALASGSITAAVIATGAIDADAIADGAIDAGALAADCITAAKIANGAIDAATFAADVDAEILSYLVDDATRIDGSALNTASAAVGSNGSGLTEAGGTGDHLTAVPWNAAWDAEVQSEVEDGLVAHRLDELLNADSDIDGAAPPTVGSVFHELMSKTAGSFTFDQTTDSLEALRDRGDAAWTTSALTAGGIADAVWDEAIAGHLTAGSTGNALNAAGSAGDPWSTPLPGAYGAGTAGKIVGDSLDAAVSSRSSHSAADVWAVATRTLTSAANITSTGGTVTVTSGGVTLADGVTHGGTTAKLRLGSSDATPPLLVTNSGGVAGRFTAADSAAVLINTTGVGTGLSVMSGGGMGAEFLGGGSYGVYAEGSGAAGFEVVGGTTLGTITGSLSGAVGGIAGTITTLDALDTAQDAQHATTQAAVAALSIPTADQNADALLGRNIAGGSSTGRTVKEALYVLRNRVAISGATLTVYDTTDSVAAFTMTLTTDADAEPIVTATPG